MLSTVYGLLFLNYKSPADIQHLTGDVAGLVGAEEEDGVGDFFGGSEAPERMAREEAPARGGIGKVFLDHIGFDDAGSDGIHPNVTRREFESPVAGERVDGSLGGAVEAAPRGRGGLSGDGRDVHDARAVVELRCKRVGQPKDGTKVGVESFVDRFDIRCAQRGWMPNASVIDEHVERLIVDFAGQAGDFRRGAQVGLEDAKRSSEFAGELFGGAAMASVVEEDVGPGLGEGERDGASDAASGAGNESGLAGESRHR